MRKIILVTLIVLSLGIAGLIRHKTNVVRALGAEKNQAREFIGEKIEYEVKFGSFNLGKAVFSHLDNSQLEGKPVNVMTFQTDAVRFYDLETIYSDPVTFLPLRVTRKVKGWNINEDIVEVYDQKNFILTITKFKGESKEDELKFDKISKPLHNAVLLPFYVRRVTDIKPGWSFNANFGNQEFKITLAGAEKVAVPAGEFQAYRFVSVPNKFLIWITSDERRIPIKIKDTGIFGYTLSMKNYSLDKNGK